MEKTNILIKKLITPLEIKGWAAHILLLIPRFIGGMILALDFGSSKFGMPWTDKEQGLSLFEVAAWFPEDVAKFGFPFSIAPGLFAWLAAASEAIGGLFLAAGLGTRVFAFFIVFTMLVAIFLQKWGEGTWSMLPAMGFLWIGLYCLVLGSGKLGLDNLIAKRLK